MPIVPRPRFPSTMAWSAVRFAVRGLKTAGAGVVIAMCLWAAYPRDFLLSLVYSMCISLSCWLLIDGGREVITRWTSLPLFGEPDPDARWSGWALRIGVIFVGGVVGYAIGNGIANAITGLHEPGPFNATLRQALSVLVLATVPAVVIIYFFQSREVIAKQRAAVQSAERQAAEQQLKLLESQLEPHMLFNTLANLRVLIGLDPERAQAMLDRLIAFLRASLAGSRARSHPLRQEFDRLRDYLALMEIRMGPRLQTRFVLPAELAAVQVPPLLLQPIVENSIKHGLEPKREGGRIDIEASREGEALVLRVRDSGVGLGLGHGAAANDDSGGFGLTAIRERLTTLYGAAAATFTLEPAADRDGGTLAVIKVPLVIPPAPAEIDAAIDCRRPVRAA